MISQLKIIVTRILADDVMQQVMKGTTTTYMVVAVCNGLAIRLCRKGWRL
jgi:hypothetical protein